jgi:hypothetical protein
MTLASFRSILTLGVGIVIGLLIAWGVFGRSSIGSPNTPVVPAAAPNQSELQTGASITPPAIERALTLEAKPSASASSSSSPAPQVNGLPLGYSKSYPLLQILRQPLSQLGPRPKQDALDGRYRRPHYPSDFFVWHLLVPPENDGHPL